MGYIMNFDDNDNVQFIKDGHKKPKNRNKKKYKRINKMKKKSKIINRK